MMRVRIISIIAVAILAITLLAAAKPPPPPTLGVPHVVVAVVPSTGTSPIQQDVSCPAGEVALSAAVQHYDNAGNRMPISSEVHSETEPITDADRPVGYHFTAGLGQGSVRLYVTCAPVQ